MARNQHRGTIISVDASGVLVDLDGAPVFCRMRGRFYEDLKGQKGPVAPGDRVLVSHGADEEAVVEEIEPRTSRLSRVSADGESEQVLAANVDRLAIIVATKNPPLRPGLIDRLVVAAKNQGIEPLVVVNKVDLGRGALAEEVRETYRELGYPVVFTSATGGIGLDELAAELRDRTTVLSGHSGVGKSSLLNALMPDLDLRVAAVSRQTTKGRHTTTRATLLPLRDGGYVIDTPGIRAFGLFDVTRADLDIFFAEFEPYIERCRFYNCTHSHEPRCAVRAGVEAGAVSRARYAAYLRILATLEE
jgi:ribosome biogenesis GTPase